MKRRSFIKRFTGAVTAAFSAAGLIDKAVEEGLTFRGAPAVWDAKNLFGGGRGGGYTDAFYAWKSYGTSIQISGKELAEWKMTNKLKMKFEGSVLEDLQNKQDSFHRAMFLDGSK
jgi:hypothetical protein